MRLIIDAMNVIGCRPDGWWNDRHGAMLRLVDQLERWAAVNDDDLTVIFEKPPAPRITSTVIEVAHAPRARANSADDEIVRRVTADARPFEIRVVTSDNWLADQVRAAGASVEPSEGFRNRIEAA